MKSLSVTIQLKATEQYFPVVLLIILYKVVLTFESVDETFSSCEVFSVILFTMLFVLFTMLFEMAPTINLFGRTLIV